MRDFFLLRPSHVLLMLIFVVAGTLGALTLYTLRLEKYNNDRPAKLKIATAGLGLTDLCVATEARYTRHPAVSDRVAPFMDHPDALEHFPTGSFFAPPWRAR